LYAMRARMRRSAPWARCFYRCGRKRVAPMGRSYGFNRSRRCLRQPAAGPPASPWS
jgi:hypothetical protein